MNLLTKFTENPVNFVRMHNLNPIPDEYCSECIRFWSDLAEFLGLSRSAGEVYGHIFLSEMPLSADEVAKRTQSSRSGSGQHLKLLVEIGAIRVSQNIQDRKTHFELQTDLGVFIRRLTNTRIFPKFAELNEQMHFLQMKASETQIPHLNDRIDRLARWKQKIEPLAKILKSII